MTMFHKFNLLDSLVKIMMNIKKFKRLFRTPINVIKALTYVALELYFLEKNAPHARLISLAQ